MEHGLDPRHKPAVRQCALLVREEVFEFAGRHYALLVREDVFEFTVWTLCSVVAHGSVGVHGLFIWALLTIHD